jgi:pimeloyl-ACP methyl ester carboxylesterase
MDCLGNHSTCEVSGIKMHWQEIGSGRPLVLLHGLADSHRSWHRVAPQLAANRRVISVDLPGHGLSGRPDASYSLDWHATVLGQWMDKLGLDEIDLVGHSFGGGVAQFLLLSHASRVRRLALVAPGGLGREVGIGLRLLSLPGAERVVQPFLGIGTHIALGKLGHLSWDDRRRAAWVNSAPGTARALVRSVREVIDLGGQHRHFLDRAHDVQKLPPLSLFWGDSDPVLPIVHAHRAMRYMSEVKLTTFANTGHFPHLEQPEKFLAALSPFLDDSEARRARIAFSAAPPKRPRAIRRGMAAVAKGARSVWRFIRPRRQAEQAVVAQLS